MAYSGAKRPKSSPALASWQGPRTLADCWLPGFLAGATCRAWTRIPRVRLALPLAMIRVRRRISKAWGNIVFLQQLAQGIDLNTELKEFFRRHYKAGQDFVLNCS